MNCEHMVYFFKLPFPPSVNHYWRHRVVKGRSATYVSPQGMAFRNQVVRIMRKEGLAKGIDYPVEVEIVLRPPNRMRRDLDNYGGKALLDSLTKAGFWVDDCQVRKLSMEWGKVIKGGEAIVTVSRHEEAE